MNPKFCYHVLIAATSMPQTAGPLWSGVDLDEKIRQLLNEGRNPNDIAITVQLAGPGALQ